MRYAQTVRFNLSTDREKIDSSSKEVQDAIDLTNALLSADPPYFAETQVASTTGTRLNQLLQRVPGLTDTGTHPNGDEFIIMNNTTDNIELGSQITFNGKSTDNIETTMVLDGGVLMLEGNNSKISITNTDSSGNITLASLTDQSCSMKFTEPVTNNIDELIFDSNSLSLIDTNNNVEENRIDIEPNKISFTTKTEELTSNNVPNPAITGVTNTEYTEVTIQLNDTPHETGPEYKLCATTYLDGVNSQDLAFSMNINIGTWFRPAFSSDYTQLASDLSTFTTGTDIITFSKLSSSSTNNLFYRRDISSNEISIAWRTNIATGIKYKLIQVA